MTRIKGIWLAVALSAIFWICGTGANLPIKPSNWILALLALGACVWDFRRAPELHLPPWLFALGALFLPTAIIFPFPFSLFCWAAVASCLILLSGRRVRLVRGLGLGMAAFAGILAVQTAVWPVVVALATRYHAVTWLSGPTAWVLSILGLSAAASDGAVRIQTFEQVLSPIPTWEALAMIPTVLMLIPMIIIAIALRVRGRRLLAALSLSLIYVFLRYCVLLILYTTTSAVQILFAPFFLALSFVPLALLWSSAINAGIGFTGEVCVTRRGKRLVLAAVAAFLAVTLIIFAFTFCDPGSKKPGRLMIDDGHSNWEWTTQPYDTHWYGQASGYNYYCLAQYLGYFYDVEINFKPLTRERLKDRDILILKTPTVPYGQDEVDAIEEFVRRGGGVYLIGDHTNVFGMTTNINPVAKRFGMMFKCDATYDLPTGGLSVYDRPKVFPPVPVQHMPRFLFGTSCSMANSLATRNTISGYGLSSLMADYSEKNFFPKSKRSPEMEFGLLTQAATARLGRGRVAAFTDSTVFSNFWMFMPGKPELFLNTCEWLNRTNRLGWVNWGAGILGFLLLFGWGILMRGYPFWLKGVCLGASLALGLTVSATVVGYANARSYPTPVSQRPITYVNFESQHSSFTLPSESLNAGMTLDNHYHTFYVWTQRLGLIPRVASREQAFDGEGLAIIVNPNKPFTNADVAAVKRHLERGGRVLVLDGPTNSQSTVNELLPAFGLQIDHRPVGLRRLYETSKGSGGGAGVLGVANAYSVQNGIPLLTTPDGFVVLATKRVGEGELTVFCASHTFTDAEMGVTSAIPTPTQQEIYRFEYWLLEQLAKKEANAVWPPLPELESIFGESTASTQQKPVGE